MCVCVCVCVGGGGGGGQVISYICHSTDVRAKWPFFFFSAASYMIGHLFFQQKVYA